MTFKVIGKNLSNVENEISENFNQLTVSTLYQLSFTYFFDAQTQCMKK